MNLGNCNLGRLRVGMELLFTNVLHLTYCYILPKLGSEYPVL